MANVSKNAKTGRGSSLKTFVMHNGKEVEVCSAKFIGSTAGMRDYTTVEDKNAKVPLVDENGNPLIWKITTKYQK